MSDIGAPDPHIGAAMSHFDAPDPHIGAAMSHFDAPDPHIGAAMSHFDAPNPHIGARAPRPAKFFPCLSRHFQEIDMAPFGKTKERGLSL
jgi:hypothetical protein